MVVDDTSDTVGDISSDEKKSLVGAEDSMNYNNDELTLTNFDDKTHWEMFKLIIGAQIGTFLEWYDFTIFGLFAAEIGYQNILLNFKILQSNFNIYL